MKLSLSILSASLCFFSIAAKADLVTNGTFDNGTLTGWTTYTVSGGDIGGGSGYPAVTSFDTTGNGASNAATFSVGGGGGGLMQTVHVSSAGYYLLTADFAGRDPYGNFDIGTFTALIDSTILASDPLGFVDDASLGNDTARGTFTSPVYLTAGDHTLSLQISRIYDGNPALHEYYDNISLTEAPTAPEPGSFLLLSTGVAGLMGIARRKGKLRF
jgi:hypothetical protein